MEVILSTLKLPKKRGAAKDAERRATAELIREEKITAAVQWLVNTYPAFAQSVPLALGSHKQTIRDKPKGISSTTLKLARKRWCECSQYLHQLTLPGAIRYNLDGTVAGAVSDEHRQKAIEALASR